MENRLLRLRFRGVGYVGGKSELYSLLISCEEWASLTAFLDDKRFALGEGREGVRCGLG